MKNKKNDVLVKDEDCVRLVQLNRARKKNAITSDMFIQITEIFKETNDLDSIKVIILTGSGDTFTSGNDLNNFSNAMNDGKLSGIDEMADFGRKMFQDFIEALLNSKKLLMVVVNGDAVGIGFTMLPLFHIAYSVPDATMFAPFLTLGQTPEGCSTYTFPKIFGRSRSTEILLQGDKVSAKEALKCGLVSKVYGRDVLLAEALKTAKYFSSCPKETLEAGVSILNHWNKDTLHQVNTEECRVLRERWKSPECLGAVMNFLAKKSSKL